MKTFFDDINCEGLYKLLIVSLKNENKKCHILGEDEGEDEARLDAILDGAVINHGSDNFKQMLDLYLNFNLIY